MEPNHHVSDSGWPMGLKGENNANAGTMVSSNDVEKRTSLKIARGLLLSRF